MKTILILALLSGATGLLTTPESGLNDVFGVIVAVAVVRLLDYLLPNGKASRKERKRRRTKAEMEADKAEQEAAKGQTFIPGTITLIVAALVLTGCLGGGQFSFCRDGKCIHVHATNDIPFTAPLP